MSLISVNKCIQICKVLVFLFTKIYKYVSTFPEGHFLKLATMTSMTFSKQMKSSEYRLYYKKTKRS